MVPVVPDFVSRAADLIVFPAVPVEDWRRDLLGVIETVHDCRVTHVTSEVSVEFVGVWQGSIETYYLAGCTAAQKCYAWRRRTTERSEYVIVLEVPPVSSALTALERAAAAAL